MQPANEQVDMTNRLVVHLTSAHPRNDTRILVKQCRSLAAAGYRVVLVVADGEGDEHKEEVVIMDVGCLPGRLNRMFKTTRRVLEKAVELDADVYHLHDPELIPSGLSLKRRGKRVIFDSHEDVSTQLLSKPYLWRAASRVLSRGFSAFERYACSQFDGIVAATPFIREKFLGINPVTVDVNNFPVIGEVGGTPVPWSAKRTQVCYIGTVGAIRGIREMVRACEYLHSSARLALAGRFYESDVEAEVKGYRGWERVDELGYLDRRGVRDVLAASVAGLVTLHPLLNYLDALPVKMFEYMAAGVPVIASNFPLWREILLGNDCGICVDPLDARAIGDAVDCLVGDPKRSAQMGQNGREAVMRKYNWTNEERKLLKLYADVLAG
jgi:glycosyltransferase involved in cell wall biosynthesis